MGRLGKKIKNWWSRDEARALLNGGKVVKTLYVEGGQYLRVELYIINTRIQSQIFGGEE